MIEAVILSHVFLATVATIAIFRLDYLERDQAILQTVVSWVVPLIGAVLILVFQSVVHRNMTTKIKPDKPNPNSKEEKGTSLLH